MNKDLRRRASNKAFARMSMLLRTIEQNKKDILESNHDGIITTEQMYVVLRSNETELKVWEYITKLIETDEE
jgi:NMD protein affecting ribosome stability and mRNA decay